MADARSRSFVRTQVGRGKKLGGMAMTIAGGYRKAQEIGAFRAPPRDRLPRYIQVFCRKMCLSFGVEVVEVEPVPQHHALWVSNHISWLDIPVVGSVSPAFFLSKSEIAEWPVFGKLARAAGTLFIQRGSGDAGSVAEQIAEFLNNGSSVVFFPEATTTDGRVIKRIHGKLLQAAIDTGILVQPMVICYVNAQGRLSDEVPYYGDIQMKDSLRVIMDSEKITAYVLPLPAIDPKGLDRNELTAVVQSQMQAGLARLHQQVLTAD